MQRINLPGDGYIEARDIRIDENVKFGKNVQIKVRGTFAVGHDSYIGDRFSAVGENIQLGAYFYNGPTDSRGMVIGGGGANFPFANLTIGNGFVCHTGHINLAKEVIIGDDVGMSHDVDILTHGFWGSVLEGYPRNFGRVSIGNNVILGWKTVVMPGVTIGNNITIGANSTVTKDLLEDRGIYVGSPAKRIGFAWEITNEDAKLDMVLDICKEFSRLMDYYEEPIVRFGPSTSTILLNDLVLDLNTRTCSGTHDIVTDAFRDFIRRYGIRFFVAGRPFGFHLTRKKV
jgi:acetyltransferase-like isoleucine patch superfamily enzyme